MELVIITGLSGAGKSQAVDAMEDIGFYCIDNIPPSLIPKLAELCEHSGDSLQKIAIVSDIRVGEYFQDLFIELENIRRDTTDYKLLFLDASDTVLMNRYNETRRRHPLMDVENGSVEQAIAEERKALMPARERADYIIDTSYLRPQQLKQQVIKLFSNEQTKGMLIECSSFGYKYGIPSDADLVFDVRCLPNPFYEPELKHKTGLDVEVRDFVLQFDSSKKFLKKIYDLIEYSIPLYQEEGKSHLVIAFGCTGGKHRSVTFAETIHRMLNDKKHYSIVNHRDITK